MTHQADPHVYFSAERTLLSWVRGLAMMGFGFVVARFGSGSLLAPARRLARTIGFAMAVYLMAH